jgi:hypothetical protein
MRIKTLAGAAALTLAGTLLTACGGGGGSSASGDYCSELKDDASYFKGLDSSDASSIDFEQVFSRMHALADDAPSEVADDWKTLDDAFTTLEDALKEAGIKPSDLSKMTSGQLPEGVDPSKLAALAPKLQALSDSKFSEAAQRISDNAKDKCGVDLGNS